MFLQAAVFIIWDQENSDACHACHLRHCCRNDLLIRYLAGPSQRTTSRAGRPCQQPHHRQSEEAPASAGCHRRCTSHPLLHPVKLPIVSNNACLLVVSSGTLPRHRQIWMSCTYEQAARRSHRESLCRRTPAAAMPRRHRCFAPLHRPLLLPTGSQSKDQESQSISMPTAV